jgi:hypothetical protein
MKKHLFYYVSLFLILGIGSFVAIAVGSDVPLRMLCMVLVAVLYVSWGIVHHTLNHDISTKIVVEYVLIASLGITLVFFFLKTA